MTSVPKRRRISTSLCVVILVIAICDLLAVRSAKGEFNMPLHQYVIQKWAENFGRTLYDVSARATALTDIRTDYLLMEPKIRPINGTLLVEQMRHNLERMLSKKERALKRLVNVAEEAHKNHSYNSSIKLYYPMSKKLNTSEFKLERNAHFNNIEVNINQSTVHVPTNVYDQSENVSNAVDWSEKLDVVFRQNYINDPTLTWQYFGSATGFLRNFPGAAWRTEKYRDPNNDIDIYDCRVRGWYIQAAAYPKDIVILLDVSGSMKGLRIEIAKATVTKILDTLTDDDFFNVLNYTHKTDAVVECFNDTMVQATSKNRKIVEDKLKDLKTAGIARLDDALPKAFELLNRTNSTGSGAQCNQAIMIVTDGSPETYEHIFETYNAARHVRIFTFLIGREVGDSWQVRWMACSNRGRFSHIASIADVHEHVQEYIHVLSRPMVIAASAKARQTDWTGVYNDNAEALITMSRSMVLQRDRTTHWTKLLQSTLTDERGKGLALMITVAQPVFDTKNETVLKGKLLGVMGTDVPLKELTKLTPQYKLGVNGYAFAITNNGYVIFHPRFKPMTPNGDAIKPNFDSVNLDDIESMDVNNLLRNNMVDRKTGSIAMEAAIQFDDNKRASIRKQHFFYTEIRNTPYSLGIALPDDYGLNVVDGTRSLKHSDKRSPDEKPADLSALTTGDIVLAPWSYCKMSTGDDSVTNDVATLIRYLHEGKEGLAQFEENCDTELIESLLFDAEATRGTLASWMKENYDGTMNYSASKRNGIELVFIGTKSGLTRYLNITDHNDRVEPSFISDHRSTIEELYYTRAVENGENVFTFSIPFPTGGKQSFNKSSVVVTASTPIFISDDNREAVAAVVGLQIKYSHFYEFFVNSTQICPQESGKSQSGTCNQVLSCNSPEINCYLIDNNGYVILSENSAEIGLLFGQDGCGSGRIMNDLIIKDEYESSDMSAGKGIFKKLLVYDHQATCDIISNNTAAAAISLLSSPICRFFSFVTYFINQLAISLTNVRFLMEYWWSASAYSDVINVDGENYGNYSSAEQASEEYQSGDNLYDEMINLAKYVSKEKHETFLEELRNIYRDTEGGMERGRAYIKQLLRQHAPHKLGEEPCTAIHTYYSVNFTRLPQWNTFLCDGNNCSITYSVNHVPGTNLILLAMESLSSLSCTCWPDTPINITPQKNEIVEPANDDCDEGPPPRIYRKRPDQCHAYHPEEDSTDCGRAGTTLRPTVVSTLMVTLATLCVTSLLLSTDVTCTGGSLTSTAVRCCRRLSIESVDRQTDIVSADHHHPSRRWDGGIVFSSSAAAPAAVAAAERFVITVSSSIRGQPRFRH